MAGIVRFRLEGKAESLEVGPRAGEQASFQRGDIGLILETEVNDQGHETGDCLVTCETTREVTDEAYQLLQDEIALLNDEAATEGERIREGFTILSEREARWLIDPPEAVLQLFDDVGAELQAEAARLVQLLRWLFNRPWPAKALGRPRLRWSLDGAEWQVAETRAVDLPTFGGGDILLEEQGVDLIARLWEPGRAVEPLARQIFLEAYSLADENPRAALVLAVAAAEVGVKQFAASQSDRESEAWLINKAPSPPIRVLLKDYLPFFTDKRTTDGRAVPKHLQTALHEAAESRNNIVHQGDSGYDEETLAEVFLAVNDLLYLLDWFAGNDWAFRHLQDNTREAYAS